VKNSAFDDIMILFLLSKTIPFQKHDNFMSIVMLKAMIFLKKNMISRFQRSLFVLLLEE